MCFGKGLVLGIFLGATAFGALTDGLMLHYDFEAFTQEGLVPDKSGNGYDGTVGGSLAFGLEEGVFGLAGRFEQGAPVYVDLPAPIPHEEIPAKAITVVAWVNHDPMTDHMEIFMPMSLDPAKQLCHCELRNPDMARLLIRTPIDPAEDIININNVGSVPAGEWVHYAATYDSEAGVGILYLDGEIVQEQSATREMYNNWDTGARVGYTVDNARPFYGRMDDFAIWRRALSQDEIQELMANGIAAPEPPKFLFQRGDVNADGKVNIADAIRVLSVLFAQGVPPTCRDTADANDDGAVNIADAIKILGHLFAQSGPLPPPFGQCDVDPTADSQDCAGYAPCEAR